MIAGAVLMGAMLCGMLLGGALGGLASVFLVFATLKKE